MPSSNWELPIGNLSVLWFWRFFPKKNSTNNQSSVITKFDRTHSGHQLEQWVYNLALPHKSNKMFGFFSQTNKDEVLRRPRLLVAFDNWEWSITTTSKWKIFTHNRTIISQSGCEDIPLGWHLCSAEYFSSVSREKTYLQVGGKIADIIKVFFPSLFAPVGTSK